MKRARQDDSVARIGQALLDSRQQRRRGAKSAAGAVVGEARASSGDRSAVRNQDASQILRHGFVETPSTLLEPSLRAALLARAQAGGGHDISNAKELRIGGSLLQCVRDAVCSSPTVRQAAREVFSTPYVSIPYVSVLSTHPGQQPQLPHADDTCNRELIGLIHLRPGQAPTRCAPYDSSRTWPTGWTAKCTACDAAVPLTDKMYRERRHLRIGFRCDSCGGGGGGGGARGAGGIPPRHASRRRESRPAEFGDALRAAFGELLEEGAPQLCRHSLGKPHPDAGDGNLALSTLLHRGPGTLGRDETRHVLFYSLRPEYADMDPAAEEAAGREAEYHPDEQVTAAYLLANRPGDADLARRLTAMYAEDGYDLSLHATSRGEQPKQRAGAAGDVYDVQDVLGKRRNGGVTEYLIRWKGYPPSHNSWEPAANVPERVLSYFRAVRSDSDGDEGTGEEDDEAASPSAKRRKRQAAPAPARKRAATLHAQPPSKCNLATREAPSSASRSLRQRTHQGPYLDDHPGILAALAHAEAERKRRLPEPSDGGLDLSASRVCGDTPQTGRSARTAGQAAAARAASMAAAEASGTFRAA